LPAESTAECAGARRDHAGARVTLGLRAPAHSAVDSAGGRAAAPEWPPCYFHSSPFTLHSSIDLHSLPRSTPRLGAGGGGTLPSASRRFLRGTRRGGTARR